MPFFTKNTPNSAKNQAFFWIAGLALVLVLIPFFSFGATPAPSISINGDAGITKVRDVTLSFGAPSNVTEMKISNTAGFVGAVWEPLKTKKNWTLDYGAGMKTVYVKFRTASGSETTVVSDSISLSVPQNMTVTLKIDKGAKTTTSRYVVLTITTSEGVETVAFSNSSSFSASDKEDVKQKTFTWILSSGSGAKTVFAEFTSAEGTKKVVSASITYTEPANVLPEGSVVKADTDTLYYVGFDGRLHSFANLAVFHSWYKDFSAVVFVSHAALNAYQIGTPVCVRPGTWLIRFASAKTVYAVEPGCVLRPIRSEAEGYVLYGPPWQSRILTFSEIHGSYYTVRSLGTNSGKDTDGDGLDAETETLYGASDSAKDTDNDGVSDFEEIEFWGSSPSDADTDNDGVKDGPEILQGTSPTSFTYVSALPAGYEYPVGSLIAKIGGGGYYYRHSNGVYYSVGKNFGGSFASNRFDPLFLSASPYEWSFVVKGPVGSSLDETAYPSVKIHKQIFPL